MIQNVCNVLQDIKSPFETSTELFTISGGVVADKAITADILGSNQTGKDAFEKFAEMRLVIGVVEFFDLQSVSWILAEFCYNRSPQGPYTGTCTILQETINGFLCPLIVFRKM